jgi:eukaryotic-like serine/threonine-protein kinase
VWSPDGNRILYSTLRGSKAGIGIFQKASNGTGGDDLLLPSDRPDREVWATDWSHDGRFVLFSRGDLFNNTEAEIWVLPLTGDKQPKLFVRAAAAAYDAHFSPDGKWVAYTSRESGTPQVYVVPFQAARFLSSGATSSSLGGKWQISSAGGSVPRWRGDGSELFYVVDNNMMAVEVEGNGFQVGRTRSLFVAPSSPFPLTYDASRDGKRFVMAVPDEENLPLVLVFNWTGRTR